LALFAVRPACLAAQTIDTIVIVRHNVYDRNRDAPRVIATLGNDLHITTDAWVVRRALLIGVGDTYDSAKVAESARALRALDIFRAVDIDTVRMNGRLALRVETDDAWSTLPDFDYSSTAGDVMWAAAFTEGNVLGTGTALEGRYESTPDRHSISVGYNGGVLLGRRTVLSGQYSAISDGRTANWSFGDPFYEIQAPRSLMTDGAVAHERVLQFRDGVLADSVEHRELLLGLSGGVRLHATPMGYTRAWFSALWRREDFDVASTAPFPRSQFAEVGAGIEAKRVRFQVLKDFNSFARQEDVDLSQTLRVGLWAAPKAFGYDSGQAGVGGEMSGQLSGLWPAGFAVLHGQVAGVLTKSGVDSGRVIGSATVASQNLPRESVILHVEGGELTNPKPGDEFDLWRYTKGPRLYGSHQFTGTRMAWLAVEDRVLVKEEVLGLFGVGVAPFFDYGGAWYNDEPSRLGGDVGIALRLGPTRMTIADVGQFAFGYRFGSPLTGGHWAFSATGNILY
jgi:hypothetical protein